MSSEDPANGQIDSEKAPGSQDPNTTKPGSSLGWAPDFPDGGARAWSVAASAAGLMFCSFGYINAFGVYQEYYQYHQLANRTPDEISWLGSLQVFFLFAATLIGGPLFDRYGSKVVWPSSILFVFSVMMTSLCKEYYQFMLAQGVLEGIAAGMLMAPGLAAVGHYFLKNRGAAMGLAVGGSSVGGIIFPIVLTQLLDNSSIGFAWSVRACGFIILVVIVPSTLALRPRLPPRKKRLILWSAFQQPSFVGLIGCNFLLTMGLFIPMFYLPNYAIEHGMSPAMSQNLVAILNGASFCGRIILGILADRSLGRFTVLGLAGLATGIISFCWTRATTPAAIIVYSAIYGFTSGAVVSMLSACFAQVTPDPRNIGTYMGLGMFCVSFGALIGTPISGVLVSRYGGYLQTSILSGAVIVIGALLVVVVKRLCGKAMISKF
ncbi:hypothetical protein N7457_004015 [Penicillium paradoxum]|uniref:uncharacterized protein n=1 Tax=Penicillium paradoxum TaxID=176176 RepID=UPI002546DF56|nr:uncharacterized protein N7457_004015 [Penicillium paradoxum]KAJ5782241.1 hypothetical protein N7457_004015 [Penicillium paradoxum]